MLSEFSGFFQETNWPSRVRNYTVRLAQGSREIGKARPQTRSAAHWRLTAKGCLMLGLRPPWWLECFR